MALFSNRYVSMDEQPGGVWIVRNEVTGQVMLPVETLIKAEQAFNNFQAANRAMAEITQQYQIALHGSER